MNIISEGMCEMWLEAAGAYGVACGTGWSPPAPGGVRAKAGGPDLGFVSRCQGGSGSSFFT